MRRIGKLAPLAIGIPLALTFLGAGTALAAGTGTANLSPVPLNGSQGSGTVTVGVNGTTINFSVAASGLADGPHAAHIHFGASAQHECPTASADTNHDLRISTTEGAPAYGPVVVSLTKTGDTSPASTLAVSRFAAGTSIQYMRGNVTVSSEVAQAVTKGQGVIVIHGVKYNDPARANAKSDLDPSLPASATDPAICGRLRAAPSGGAATGAGGASSSQDATLLGLGGALLLAAAGTGAVAARRSRG